MGLEIKEHTGENDKEGALVGQCHTCPEKRCNAEVLQGRQVEATTPLKDNFPASSFSEEHVMQYPRWLFIYKVEMFQQTPQRFIVLKLSALTLSMQSCMYSHLLAQWLKALSSLKPER